MKQRRNKYLGANVTVAGLTEKKDGENAEEKQEIVKEKKKYAWKYSC